MSDIQTTWTDEQGETWVPFSDYMHLKAALKTERNKALREAAEIAHYMPIIGGNAERYADKIEEEILALITDDQLAANVRIAELERALGKIKYWFDTDPEILDEMDVDELADHNHKVALIEAALSTEDKLNG